jgi:hypothetical protein
VHRLTGAGLLIYLFGPGGRRHVRIPAEQDVAGLRLKKRVPVLMGWLSTAGLRRAARLEAEPSGRRFNDPFAVLLLN